MVVEANKLAIRRHSKIPIPTAIILGSVAWAGLSYALRGDSSMLTNALLPMLLLIVLLALVYYVFLPWQSRRHYRETSAFADEISVEWDAEKFRLGGARGNMALAWSDFYRWTDNDSLLLLYQSHILYHVVPKSALTQEQIGELRAHLESAGVKRR